MTVFITVIAVLVFFIFWNTHLLFYRDRVRHHLEPHEEKCFSPNCRTIRHDNGSDTAYFFIHGYPTTPYMYKYPTDRLSAMGYDVYAPLIPTFGADWKEFAETNYTEWFTFIDEEYLKMRRSHEHLHVVGVSMGGATALKLAEKYSGTKDEMDTITVIAAPVTYNSWWRDRIVTNRLAYIARTVALFRKTIDPKTVDGKPGAEDGEETWTGYDGIFSRPSVSFVWNLRKIRKDLPKITVPILSIHDRGDRTVPFANQAIILREINSRDVRKEVREMEDHGHSRHSLLMYDSTKESVTDSIIRFTLGERE